MSKGVGWFNDIFTVKVEVEGSGATTDILPPRLEFIAYEPQMPGFVVNAGGVLRGSVVITPPEGRTTVDHRGVSISLVTKVQALDRPDRPEKPLAEKPPTLELATAAVVEKEVRLPFEFDLANLALPESFGGDLFWVHHLLSVEVARPWYTFAVAAEQPLFLLRSEAPRAPPPTTPHFVEMTVRETTARLELTTDTFAVGAALTGTLSLKGDVSPTTKVWVVLSRRETLKMNGGETAVETFPICRVAATAGAIELPLARMDDDAPAAAAAAPPTPTKAGHFDKSGAQRLLPPTMPRSSIGEAADDNVDMCEAEYLVTLVVKDGKAAAEAPAESVPLMVKLITAGAKVPECRATIEMKPMVTAAPVDAA